MTNQTAGTHTQTVLLNPYSIRLEKHPLMNVDGKPVHVHGDFRVYKYCKKWFIHTFKNIVIAERCAVNKELLTNLTGETKPTGEASIYHDYERPMAAMREGIEAANKLHFSIQ